MASIDFMTYNTIANVDAHNKYYIGNHEITPPERSYEIEDAIKAIQLFLTEHEEKPKETLSLVELVPKDEKSSPKSTKVKKRWKIWEICTHVQTECE